MEMLYFDRQIRYALKPRIEAERGPTSRRKTSLNCREAIERRQLLLIPGGRDGISLFMELCVKLGFLGCAHLYSNMEGIV